MNTFISLLRGINVSGKNIIRMEALKSLYESLDFKNVTTYVQSGNVVFSSEQTNSRMIEHTIDTGIEKTFGLHVPVFVLNLQELKKCLAKNPFRENRNESYLYFTFLAGEPADYKVEDIGNKKADNEEFAIQKKFVYLYCPNGYGKTKLTNNFFESTFNLNATTRNFRTMHELLKMAERII